MQRRTDEGETSGKHRAGVIGSWHVPHVCPFVRCERFSTGLVTTVAVRDQLQTDNTHTHTHTHTHSHAPQSLASLSHSTPRTFHYPQHSHKYHPPPLLHTQTHSKISTQPRSAKWVPPVYTTTCVLWILLHHKHVEKLFITNTGPVVNVGVSCVRWLDLLT